MSKQFFSISPFDTLVGNKATFHIIEKVETPYFPLVFFQLLTQMMFLAGILVEFLGNILWEVKVVVNHNRDDIRIEKKNIR